MQNILEIEEKTESINKVISVLNVEASHLGNYERPKTGQKNKKRSYNKVSNKT